jgi:hypothetical protein
MTSLRQRRAYGGIKVYDARFPSCNIFALPADFLDGRQDGVTVEPMLSGP